ncbi:ArsR/SmtB family transcription factor [Embleya sp. MST-111070]|uniref:ArsR/SmtB family transcription factor n=1 Tax=Embleya sp. MST-111070 TaxID=3398231 RepID=UPI003F73392A
MSTPLYELKAEFFKTLGHPARIRVLELLSEREHSVAEMLPEVGIEASRLSQQLAVLRRANLVVVSRREGSTVYYTLTSPQVSELLAVARGILTGLLTEQMELLQDLRATTREVSPGPPRG